MKKILDAVVFGEYTTEDVLIVAGVASWSKHLEP